MKDAVLTRLLVVPLAWFLVAPNIAALFGDASIFFKIISGTIALVALWVALSVFFLTGVYLREDRCVFHAWFHRYTINRDEIVEFSLGTQYFDRRRLHVKKVDGTEYEFKVPIKAFKLRQVTTTVENLEHWRKTGARRSHPEG